MGAHATLKETHQTTHEGWEMLTFQGKDPKPPTQAGTHVQLETFLEAHGKQCMFQNLFTLTPPPSSSTPPIIKFLFQPMNHVNTFSFMCHQSFTGYKWGSTHKL